MESSIPDRLQEILLWKQREVEEAKKQLPETEIKARAFEVSRVRNEKTFHKATETTDGTVKIIAEIKRASPSKGVIRSNFDVTSWAKSYESAGASAISVLTERKFFRGSPEDLQAVKKAVNIPVLRKDFIIDAYQLYEARLWDADAVLLISRILSRSELTDFIALSNDLALDALVEVHDESDMEKALLSDAHIIGINNRDLRTFAVSLDTTIRLSRFLDPYRHSGVCESGIHSPEDVERIVSEAGIRCFLVGEALMRSEDPSRMIATLRGARS